MLCLIPGVSRTLEQPIEIRGQDCISAVAAAFAHAAAYESCFANMADHPTRYCTDVDSTLLAALRWSSRSSLTCRGGERCSSRGGKSNPESLKNAVSSGAWRGILGRQKIKDPPEFTSEVQHQLRVLMGERHGQLSPEERCKVAELHQAGHSVRQIAAALDARHRASLGS